jgi:spermidine synthase
VIADVFAGAVTPPHLTTAEFAAATARALRPGGVYAVNVAAGQTRSGTAPRRGAGRGAVGSSHDPFRNTRRRA